MSIQDDIFDITNVLKSKPNEAKMFDSIIKYLGEVEQ